MTMTMTLFYSTIDIQIEIIMYNSLENQIINWSGDCNVSPYTRISRHIAIKTVKFQLYNTSLIISLHFSIDM